MVVFGRSFPLRLGRIELPHASCDQMISTGLVKEIRIAPSGSDVCT